MWRRLKRTIKVIAGKDKFFPQDIHCSTRRFGSDYGGWEIAIQDVSAGTIVYSFGVGKDITFDTEIIEHLGVQVFAFDPTPGSIQWLRDQPLPDRFEFFEYGIASYDGTATFYPPSNPEHISHTVLPSRTTLDVPIQVPVRRLSTIMSGLGHQSVGILKMDIEGAEYAVLEDIERSGIRPQQVLVELHHRFPGVGIRKTEEAITRLTRMGYGLFSVSPSGEEYGFLLK